MGGLIIAAFFLGLDLLDEPADRRPGRRPASCASLHEKIVPQGGAGIDHLAPGVFMLAIAAVMADLTAVSTASGTEIARLSAAALIVRRAVRLAGARARRSR